jgi:hypothetical protein
MNFARIAIRALVILHILATKHFHIDWCELAGLICFFALDEWDLQAIEDDISKRDEKLFNFLQGLWCVLLSVDVPWVLRASGAAMGRSILSIYSIRSKAKHAEYLYREKSE